MKTLRCFFTRHDPVRHILGGFRCSVCGKAGVSLDDLGFWGQGYVSPVRHVFDRYPATVTRTSEWERGTGW